MKITKRQLVRRMKAKGMPTTFQAIADLFGIRYQAVQAWPDDKPIPAARYYQLVVQHPQLTEKSS